MPVKIVIADCSWNAIDIEKSQFPEDWVVEGHQCRTEEDLIRVCEDADGILAEYAPVSRRVLSRLKRCRIVSNSSTGYDNIDAAAAKELGIAVANVPNYCTDEVADHTLALILAWSRNIVSFHKAMGQGRWDMDAGGPMYRLAGKTLGLVGFGHIARAVAKRAQSFGLQVIAYTAVPEELLQNAQVKRAGLGELLKEADIISSHIPFTDKTADFFNKAVFEKMAKKPLFVNTSRGKVVNEEDLTDALSRGLIRGAALDVLRNEPPDFTDPLFTFENVLITPHAAFNSVEALKDLRRRSARNVLNFIEGRPEEVDFV